jgi:hypothetical protein
MQRHGSAPADAAASEGARVPAQTEQTIAITSRTPVMIMVMTKATSRQ